MRNIFFQIAVLCFLTALPVVAQDGGPFAPPGSSDLSDPFAPPPGVSGDRLPLGQDLAFDVQDLSLELEQTEEEVQAEIREEAFDAALQGLLPLRPEEIRALLERFDRTQESVQIPVYPNPRPEVTVQNVPLDPGAQPVSIKVSYGHVTTVNILDVTGAPWPIEDITWAGDFEVIESGSAGAQGSHVLRITPQSEFAFGNMSMKLVTLQTPIVLTMETSRDIVHYRFDAIIPEIGPNGQAPIIQTGVSITAGDKNLTRILEGVAPQGASRLSVSGVDNRTSAYSLNGQTILRTPLTLLSPAWDSSVSSADGTKVYSFRETPVVLLSERGKTLRARITSRNDSLGDALDEQ